MINEEWARTIAKYPERYGKLSSIFYHLMQEVIKANVLPPDRIAFYMTCIRTIDLQPPLKNGVDTAPIMGYDYKQLQTTEQVQGVNQMEEE